MKKYPLPTLNKNIKTVILANGKFPTHPTPLHILDNCINLVSCDGATNKLTASNREPNAIVGDCDSLTEANKKRFAKIIHRVSDQETNDLTKAVNYCVSKNLIDIIILGATGEREDHTLGNISLLCEYQQIANTEMITDHGIFVAINKTSKFESYKGQQVSIFCLDNLPISTKGLKYSIDNKTFTRWWQATLNESENTEFIVETTGNIIVYREF